MPMSILPEVPASTSAAAHGIAKYLVAPGPVLQAPSIPMIPVGEHEANLHSDGVR